jgi:hypothetical protein
VNVPAPLPPAPVQVAPIPPAPAPVAPQPSPEAQIAQAGAQLDALTAPAYAGGTPDGALTSTPRQAAADLLNSGEREKGLERREGEINADEQTQVADKQAQAAAEKVQQANDFQQLLTQSQAKYEAEHAQTQAAYDKYKAAAGTLKDPESQFYEDKGQGYRVQTALAAFAAGIGAGFNGQAGNPVLDLLQKKVQSNYDAHKQNIEDLYNSGVQAGKIEDTSENHAKFMQDAKLRSYELQSAHVKDELAAIAARAQSPLAKTAAAKTIEQIDQNQIGVRQKLAQQEALAAAAKLATERARTKEVREAYQKALEKHADLAPEDARLEATKDLHALGFNASETAPIFEANGVRTNPETGEPVFPEAKAVTGPLEPTYDADGKLQIPTRDPATGKQLKPEDRQRIQDDARDRTVNVDGSPRLAVSKEAAKAFQTVQEALPEADRLIRVLNDSFAKGDKGAYDQARNELIELSPKLYGFTRGPSGAQAGESGASQGGDPRGTVAAQIPEFTPTLLGTYSQTIAGFNNRHALGGNTPVAVAQEKLKGLGQTLQSLRESAFKSAFPTTREERRKETIAKTPVADLAASLGLKPSAATR